VDLDRETFGIYVEIWEEATEIPVESENPTDHPAFQAIVEGGEAMVPFILALIQRRPSRIVDALFHITGENPCPVGHEDNLEYVVLHWLAWGRARDLVISG
jgi:hypothetical protein